SFRTVHDGRLAWPGRPLPAEPVLPERRSVPRCARGRADAGVPRHRRGRFPAPAGLPRPGVGAEQPVPAPLPPGVPEGGGDARGTAQPRRGRHPAPADAPARLLGKLRRPAPPRRAPAGHHCHPAESPPGRPLLRRGQPAARPRVELVAQRLVQYARVVGRENVIAGADCGFATFAARPVVDPKIAWAKLGSMVEGARLASKELWK
ncbi:MAG: 5-methyltetrahydropteroyltriglutamate--homocysteine methyltransferase, partial [bacterium]